MSSSIQTLPSDSDITSADADQRRSLTLQAFSYGTDYDRWPRVLSTVLKRSQEAAAVLVKAWSSSPVMESMLVDVLWLVESLVPVNDEDESYQALVHILKELTSVPHRQEFLRKLQGTLDPALLEATNVLPQGGKESLVKRLRKLNTDMYYRQQKYNLLQEESEGYAKLLTLLLTASATDENSDDENNNLSTCTSECMAAFDLDPNRVLDLTVDVLESQVADSTANTSPLLKLMQDFCLPKVPHLIGFKLSSYQSSQGQVPPTLYKTIAVLAKNDLLDLDKLLPHLPPVSDIEDAYKICENCERQRIRAMGRISLSGGKKDNGEAELAVKSQGARASVSKNVRIRLALEFLKDGDWNLAMQVLEGTDVCSHVCTLLPDTVGTVVCDLVQGKIKGIYQALVHPPCLSGELSQAKPKTNGLNGSLSLEEVTEALLAPLLCIVDSGCIESHPILYCELCRLIRALFDKRENAENLSAPTYSLLRSFLVPSLSLFPPNPAISAELWSVLSVLPYSTRYRLYRDWCGPGLEKDGIGGKPLCLVEAEANAGKAARYTLKRLSKDNVRDMGRQVAKVTHSNPLVVFTTILNQVESYDNLIQMMVETVRFVTPLSLDVLGYCVLSRLSGSSDSCSGVNRNRLKGDGVNVSQWLASLESFAGAFYKKCPDVECRGILSYLVRRLKDGSVVELGVLRTLLTTAGGYSFADYSSAASLSKVQLEGRSGSQLLKRETFAFGVVEKLNQRSSQQLRSVLQSDGMGVTLLILLSQVRSRVLFHQSGMRSKPIKLIGNLFDTCQVVMGLLLEFLTDSTEEEDQAANSSIAKYAGAMPTLEALHEQYGLDPAAAWMLCRPLIRAAMSDYSKKSGRNKLTKLDMTLRKFKPTEAATRKFLPEPSWSFISPDLFDCFFSYSMYDITCPESCYETEISRLSKEVERLTQHQKGGAGAAAQKSVLAATAASAGATEMEIRRAMAFSKADEVELARVKHNAAVLASDLETQKKHSEQIRGKLNYIKNKLFTSEKISPSAAMTFLTQCIYPRCTLSPDDALYCAKFVFLLHELGTPGFGTLHYLDELVNAIAGALYCVSEGEAANMALLLWETWSVVSRWRYDEEAYAKEVAGKPGSFLVKETTSSDAESSEDIVSVTYEDYKALYNKWHATIGQAALGCLNSSEYMHNRACLIVLTRIVDVYPTRPVLGQKLMDALPPLQEDSNPLQDIKAMAQSYGFQITKARDDGVWKEEDAAVTKARLKKEAAAVAERKKKAAKQLAEMKRESDQLANELGDNRGRGRDDRRRAPLRVSGSGSRVQSPLNASAPVFEPPKGQSMPPSRLSSIDAARDSGRRERDDQRGRTLPRDNGRQQAFDERRDGGQQAVGQGDARRRGIHPSGLEGRWQQGGAQQSRETVVGQKRGRSPGRDTAGPGDGGARDRGDEHQQKRQRLDRDGRDGGGRDGWRGPDSRGGSRPGSPLHHRFRPPQRGPPPPPPPPPSQQQHGDRVGSRSDRRGRR